MMYVKGLCKTRTLTWAKVVSSTHKTKMFHLPSPTEISKGLYLFEVKILGIH
jgi:hypothetical protein